MLEAAITGLTLIFGIIGYFLRRMDTQQADQIKDLYEKHTKDVDKLRDLELRIASNHYERAELDKKFEKLEMAFRDGFKDLGVKFDRLSDSLTEHMRSGKT